MGVELQARPYGPDSTPEEIEAIRARVVRVDDRVLMYHEMPVPSLFQVKIFRERLDALSADMTEFDMVIDLTIAKPPNAEVREALRTLFTMPKLRRVAVFTGRNFMLNVAARFVLGAMGIKGTVHKTQEDALASLKHGPK
jgi:hypothetical protein